ncbi:MAG: hypothetical protein ALAOOOJD_04490 [bacterium]|nr:hypothetical protein [bacterium]
MAKEFVTLLVALGDLVQGLLFVVSLHLHHTLLADFQGRHHANPQSSFRRQNKIGAPPQNHRVAVLRNTDEHVGEMVQIMRVVQQLLGEEILQIRIQLTLNVLIKTGHQFLPNVRFAGNRFDDLTIIMQPPELFGQPERNLHAAAAQLPRDADVGPELFRRLARGRPLLILPLETLLFPPLHVFGNLLFNGNIA